MKKINLTLILLLICVLGAFGQVAYNPFTQNIHFTPEPTAAGFECGTVQTVVFTQGLTTAADATQWQTDPLTVTICLGGFTFNGPASSVVSGSYAGNFNWSFVSGSPNCIIGVQNQTLPGTGTNPIFPNPLSSGDIALSLLVPVNSPVGTVLSVNVSLQVPAYMATYNSLPDDIEATQTQTFCNCYMLTDAGTIGVNQTFCAGGDPLPFTQTVAASGGSGGTIIYQWQELIGATWTDINGATASSYDAPFTSVNRQYRRTAKRDLCGTWLNSNPVTITINTLPVVDAGPDRNHTCLITSSTIGTTAIAGNTYSWSPSTGLSSSTIAQPLANPSVTTSYTVTATGANGCTATDVVIVNVNTTPPLADAGPDKTLTCATTSTTIGTAAIAGNTYAWSPATALSATNIATPTANPTVTTTYTVTVTGTNGCTATDVVIVNVNTTPPVADAGPDRFLNCTTTSSVIGTTAIAGNSYSWSPATALSNAIAAQPTANPSVTTTYTVTVTGSNGCTSTDVVIVNVNNTPPTADAGSNKTTTCTITSVNIGSVAIAGNSYQWIPSTGLSSTTVAQPLASPASTTTYTVIVTGSNGCTASSTVLITVNTTPPATDAGPDKTTTCTIPSVTIGTTAVAGFAYNWSPSTGLSSATVAQPTANPLSTTSYTVTVTGTNGCTATDVVIVTVNKGLPFADAGPDRNLTCSLTSTQIGTVAIAGNAYSWSPSTALNSNSIAQPTANPGATTTYTVTVTGSNGCTATDVVIVNVNTIPPVTDAGPDRNLTCAVTSTVIGTTAVAGNTYAWSPATALSSTTVAQPTANPASTTSYTVTVTGSNGCTATDVVLVNVNTTPPTVDAGPDKSLNCTTTSTTIGTGAITGNTYAWSPSTALSSSTASQPVANPSATTTYTLTVTGTNGCTATDVVIVNVNTTPPVVDAGPDRNLTCSLTSATIGTTAIAGNTYSWIPATALSSSTTAQPVASPTATTTYTLTVTGSNGCTATDVVIVNVNTTPPVVDAGPDRNLNCTTTSATIGTSAIAGNGYSWSPATGLNSTIIAQPVANPATTTSYTVTVTGTNGCTATDVVIVNVNTTPPSADAGPDRNLTCTTTSASIGTTAIAGNTYSWSPSTALSSTAIAQPVANPTITTTYTVTVTGSNGCTATDVVIVNVNTAPPVADAGPDKNLNCTTTSSTIGVAPVTGYSYAWSPSTGLSSATIAQPIASPSVNTSYTVTVTGTNGCTASDVVIVNVNTVTPSADAGPDRNLTCSVTSATIGTAAIAGNSYSWSPATALNSSSIAQPTANPTVTTNYTVTVTGSNGCTSTDVVIVNVNTTPPVADAGSDKTLTCAITSVNIGSPAIAGNTYSWSPATALSATNIAQPIASPISTTSYTVTVTGTNGCTASDVVVITVNTTPPTANAGPNRNLTCAAPSAIIGTAAIAGNAYTWSPSTGLNSTTIAQPTASPAVTTTYTVVVTGSNGCVASSTVLVSVNTVSPTVDAGPDVNLTCSITSGTIGTTAIAGNTYLWSPATALSSTTVAQPTANPTATTSYTVTVTGSNGCTASDVVVVNVNTTPPVADAGPDKFLTCAVPSTTIGTPSVAGYSYVWSPTTGLNSGIIAQPTANPSVTTTYSVTVTGTNGCVATDVVIVNVNNIIPTITVTGTPIVCNGSTAAMTATANIGTISWSNGSSLNTQNLSAGTYTVTANNGGCIATTTVVVTVREGSVGNYVWTDLNADGINNEPASAGINGVTVQLYSVGTDLTQGTADDILLGTTVTANNAGNPGFYRFVICSNGIYYVKFPLSTNPNDTLTYRTTTPGVDNNSDASQTTGFSPIFSINVQGVGIAKDNNTIDAGYLKSLSLGNLVWNDLNKNGVLNAGEPGIQGATVTLYTDIDNDGLPDGAAIATTTTNASGLYVFNDLYPGNYIIGVEPPMPAVGNPFVSSNNGQEFNPNLNVDNNDNGVNIAGSITFSGTVSLLGDTEPLGETPNNGTSPDASSNLTVDFAFYQPVSISGNVYNDINGPANVDGVGIGMPGGVQLFALLVNGSGTVVGIAPVNPNGSFDFQDVLANQTYGVIVSTNFTTVGSPAPAIALPTGWVNVSEDCCDNTGNDGSANGSTTVVVGLVDVINVNFGIFEPLSVGNAVWNDINKNGLKDAGEPGIANAMVSLYNDANNDGVPDGAAISTTLTDANGLYVFNGLNPGNYILSVKPPNVSGVAYSSSTIGQETNPNLNVDNNDNGILTIGNETYTGTVTLSAGTEPLNELPNNASAPDNNANLTVDFGFFVCPGTFTFTPVFLCPSTTINLTTQEPAGYTGGTWTSSTGAALSSTIVGPGTYNYTYVNGTCTATGSLNVILNIPDYTPTITVSPSATTGISSVRVLVDVNEILNRTPCSDIYVFVPRLEPRFVFSYSPTASVIGGTPVSNANWQMFTSNPNFYVWKYIGATAFPAGGSSRFGFIGTYDPNSTDGATTFSVQIFQGSGGETNFTNNTDSEVLLYFR